ncbi:hypothetical protein K8R78_00865 [bacterium]|nr:hypothetical protein [bacterium]
MKNYSLVVALLILLVVSVSLADPMPVPETTEEEPIRGGVLNNPDIEVNLTPGEYYDPWLAGFGNIIPGMGYFLIKEAGWGLAELGLVGGGLLVADITSRSGSMDMTPVLVGTFVAGGAYFLGIIHAPFLAVYKNERQALALDLTPCVGLDSEGEVYPTVQLTLSF